ncbi:MAG: biopolymer transporter ExbD [Deltaproteobacteria bacterium]|nr:biopolymer transporter ExbD [Deltaproteobacteria bacterium]
MRFRREKEEEIRLGIAPLIDIVFLLLIFFMVTSHFDVASGVRIRLPMVTQKAFDANRDRVTLVIDPEGRTYFEGKQLDMKALGLKLEELVKARGLVHLVIQADKDVRHGVVIRAMDLAKTAGVHSIIIAAHWKAGEIL